MKPSAIVLTTRFPWPLDDGGRIALWQSVWSAAREYRVTLLSLVAPGLEKEPIPRSLAELDVEVERWPHRPPPLPVAAWRGLVGEWPYTLARYRNREYERRIREVVHERSPDFVLVNNLHLATYHGAIGPVPMILREQNLEYLWMARYARSLPPGPKRRYAEFQAGRLRATEAALVRKAALTLAIQEQETEWLRRLVPEAWVECLPVGVDPARFPTPEPAEPAIVLLSGNFGWPPNTEGALRFLEGAWPLLSAEHPGIRLRFAGKEPPPELVRGAVRAGAEVTGYVESMEEEYRRATILVVPLWSGAGARVKIVEASLARLPVVSTTIGAEGLGLTAGRHYLQADDPRGLAEHVTALLRAPERKRELIDAARAFAMERWTLEAVAHRQNQLCALVARAKAPASASG